MDAAIEQFQEMLREGHEERLEVEREREELECRIPTATDKCRLFRCAVCDGEFDEASENYGYRDGEQVCEDCKKPKSKAPQGTIDCMGVQALIELLPVEKLAEARRLILGLMERGEG